MLAAGEKVKHYSVVDKIASGGMGDVYLAHDTKLNRKVALKFLIQSDLKDHENWKLFLDEARAQASLSHPCIVTLYEIDEYRNIPYMVLEYIQGMSLKEMIEAYPVDIETAVKIGIEICKGLNRAHKLELIHGDIKPANILIDQDGHAKILDFGLARIATSTDTGSVKPSSGTIHYMAPEQLQGTVADHRADIFSFGVLMYEILTGVRPFSGDYEAALVYSIVNQEPASIADYNDSIPESLQKIIKKALNKNPENRYENAKEIIDELKGVLTEMHVDDTIVKPDFTDSQSSIAILHFKDISPDQDQEYFCDGITEEIINSLLKISGIRVVSRTSSFQFKKQDLDVREIGQILDVDTALEGSVRKAGDQLRITAKLVDVSNGYYLWSESYDSNLEDVFTFQDEISRAIAEKLNINPEHLEDQQLVCKSTESIEAYNHYLRGRYYWNRRYEGGLQKSIQYFQQAIGLDPLYSQAYAGLADTFNIIGFYNFMSPNEACLRAKSAAAKALDLAPDLAEAHTAMGWVYTFYDWNWKAAEHEFKLAIKLNNNYAIAHHYYALFLYAMSRFEESFEQMRHALDLDPLATIIETSLAAGYYFYRDHDKAIKHYLKALEFDPDFAIAHAFLAGPYVCQKKYQKAMEECKKAQTLSGGSKYPTAFLAYIYGISNQQDKARAILHELLEMSKTEYVSSYHIALIYCGLNDKDNAFIWLEKAFEERDNWMVWLNIYPVFDFLRDDSRFKQLVVKVGLPE